MMDDWNEIERERLDFAAAIAETEKDSGRL